MQAIGWEQKKKDLLKHELATEKEKPEAFDLVTRFIRGIGRATGIICPTPYNWSKESPAPHICGIWHDKNDFDEWAVEGNYFVCRKICNYGRNPEGIHAGERAREGWIIKFKQRIATARRMKNLARIVDGNIPWLQWSHRH